MENQKKMESGFRIKNMMMLEASVKRELNIDTTSQPSINIDIGVNHNENEVTVIETLNYQQGEGEQKLVNIRVTMMGIFEKVGQENINIDWDEFGKVNGAAILYPYIREQVTNFSTKAGLGAILLPPINFVNFTKKQK